MRAFSFSRFAGVETSLAFYSSIESNLAALTFRPFAGGLNWARGILIPEPLCPAWTHRLGLGLPAPPGRPRPSLCRVADRPALKALPARPLCQPWIACLPLDAPPGRSCRPPAPLFYPSCPPAPPWPCRLAPHLADLPRLLYRFELLQICYNYGNCYNCYRFVTNEFRPKAQDFISDPPGSSGETPP